jgi:biopolymer transport protein TolQ
VFWEGTSLETLYDKVARDTRDPFEEVFCAGMREWRESAAAGRSGPKDIKFSMQDRIERTMGLVADREITTVRHGLTFLATLASAGPFIGLFGTVWGIMASFQSIAVHQNTSLAVVAPGIAEALFTTALGLFAAIPAAVFYNKLSQDVKKYTLSLEGFADEFLNIISRQLDHLGH